MCLPLPLFKFRAPLGACSHHRQFIKSAEGFGFRKPGSLRECSLGGESV